MPAVAESRPMGRKRGRPRKPTGEGTQVRIDADLVTKAKYLAAQKGMHTSQLISDLLRPVVEREFKKAARDLIDDDEEPST